jgi:hypothetical protein
MEDVSDEILRQIASHPEWRKRYAVLKNLVRNPRTPAGIALSLVPRLNPRDGRIAVDRTVPDAVRRGGRGIVTMMLGIDPGTTKSCVAAIEDGVPRVIHNQEGKRTTRSVVAFTATGERLVGGPADRQALTNVDGTVDAALRLVGRRFSSREAANARRSVPVRSWRGLTAMCR